MLQKVDLIWSNNLVVYSSGDFSSGDFSSGLGGPVARKPGTRRILVSGRKCVKRVWVRVSANCLLSRKQN